VSEILTSADVQSRLEALCDTYGTGKVQKAREVYAEIERLRLAIETATRENQRLLDMIEIERGGQRSMAQTLSEIRRLSDLDVAINRPAPPADAGPKCYRCDKPYPFRIGFCEECWNAHIAAPPADAATEAAGVRLCACAWCGGALVQDPDALHRWRCINAEQRKCVARGDWYVLDDDRDYVPAYPAPRPLALDARAARGSASGGEAMNIAEIIEEGERLEANLVKTVLRGDGYEWRAAKTTRDAFVVEHGRTLLAVAKAAVEWERADGEYERGWDGDWQVPYKLAFGDAEDALRAAVRGDALASGVAEGEKP